MIFGRHLHSKQFVFHGITDSKTPRGYNVLNNYLSQLIMLAGKAVSWMYLLRLQGYALIWL